MLLNTKFLATAFGGILLFAAFDSAKAAFIQISLPDATYLSQTTKIPIPVVSTLNANPITTLSGSGETITFSSANPGTTLIIQPPVPVGFATWNSPPFVESSTPAIIQDQVGLTCAICSVKLSFSTPIKTFGLELEPDPLSNIHTLSEVFLNGTTTVGTITRTMNGNRSAMLFAGTTPDQQFTSVDITIDGTDFAMAQIRFSTQALGAAVPEPGTLLLMACGLLAVGYRKFNRAS